MARWALISGERRHDKTAFATRVVERLRARGVRVGGFLQLRSYDANGTKSYELLRLAREGRVVLAQDGVAARGPTQENFCSYAFRNEAFALARQWLEEDAGSSDVVVLDDVSKLEIQGKGHAASVRHALGLGDAKLVLICARASQLFYVIENFGLTADPESAIELPADAEAAERFADEIAALLGARASA